MDMSLEGSSVDPEQIETRFDKENSSTQSNPRNSMEYPSLPSSDLEPDAVPFSPDVNPAAAGMFWQGEPFEGTTAQPLAALPTESSRTDWRHASGSGSSHHHDETHTQYPGGDQRAAQRPQRGETYWPPSQPCQQSRENQASQPEGAGADSLSVTPVQEVDMPVPEHVSVKYDAVIICHEQDVNEVKKLQGHLNSLVLFDEKIASVAVEDDGPDLGKTEIAYFEGWLESAQIMFLFMTEVFCEETFCRYKQNIALCESFLFSDSKKEFVIPIFLEKKHKLKYLKPSIRAIKGVEYIGCQWTEKVADRFRKNLDLARHKRKESLVAKMANMTIT